jgi:hypothetical protein
MRGAARLQLCCNCVPFVLLLSLRGREGSSPFYRSRGERITCAPCYLAT